MKNEHLSTAELAAAAHREELPAPPQPKGELPRATQPPQGDGSEEHVIPLFSDQESTRLRQRWDEIQAGFVDEPRTAVEKADNLVAEAMTKLAEGFARTRSDLDHQWKQGDSLSTEDLRQGLRRYRSFFARLLAV